MRVLQASKGPGSGMERIQDQKTASAHVAGLGWAADQQDVGRCKEAAVLAARAHAAAPKSRAGCDGRASESMERTSPAVESSLALWWCISWQGRPIWARKLAALDHSLIRVRRRILSFPARQLSP